MMSAPTDSTYYQFLHFAHQGTWNGHHVWKCRNNRSKQLLGDVSWEEEWNQYVLVTDTRDQIVFSVGCLRDIADFVAKANRGEVTP